MTPVLLTDEYYSRRQNADSLFHRRDLEDRQSQNLPEFLSFLPHPEVQSLPGSLADPTKLTRKPQNQVKSKSYLSYFNYISMSTDINKALADLVAYSFSFGSSLSFKSWYTKVSL